MKTGQSRWKWETIWPWLVHNTMNEEQPPLSLVVPSMCPTTPYLLVAAVLLSFRSSRHSKIQHMFVLGFFNDYYSHD